MSTIKQTSKSIKDFLISLYLKDSNVLQIVAENSKNKETYSFALNKSYLQHNLQFINLIKEPVQILDCFESTKEQKILFQNGQLVLQYSGESISIQLFKQPALAHVYKALENSQLQAQQLKQCNQDQKASFQKLSQTVKEIAQKIQSLVGRHQFDENIKNQNDFLGQLEGKNNQINNQLQRDKQAFKQIQDKEANLLKRLQTLDNKHDDLQTRLKDLKLEEIKQKVDQLCKHQEIDKSYHTKMEKEIKEIHSKIEQEMQKIQKIVNEGLQVSEDSLSNFKASSKKDIQTLNANFKSLLLNVDNKLGNFNFLLVEYDKNKKNDDIKSQLQNQIIQKISSTVQTLQKQQKSFSSILQQLKDIDGNISLQIKNLKRQDKKELEYLNNINNKIQQFQKQLKDQKVTIDKKITVLINKDSQIFQKLQRQASRLTQQSKKLFEDTIKEVQKKNTGLKGKIDTLLAQLNSQNTLLHTQIKKQHKNLQEKVNKDLQGQNQKYKKNIQSLQKVYTQSSSMLDKKINDLNAGHTKYSELQQKKHVDINTQLSYLKKSQQFLMKRLSDYEKNSVYNYHSSYQNPELSKVLGANPNNSDGQKVEVAQQKSSLKVIFKQQKYTAYNFVNIYQIKNIIHMTYRLKVINAKENQNKSNDKNLIFLSFSDKRCLKNEAFSKERYWLFFTKQTQNLDGRYGYIINVQKDDEILCTIDLMSKLATYRIIRGKTSQILQKKAKLDTWNGQQSLFFEIASLSQITVDISV